MKKLILIVFALVSMQVFAQPKHKNGKRGKIEKLKNLSAEDMAELGTKKMTLQLNLSDEQQLNVQAILLEEAKFRKQKMKERAAQREEIEVIKPSEEERFKMKLEILDHQIAMKKKMKSVLNDEQFEEWGNKMEQQKLTRKEKGRKRHNSRN